MPFSILKTRSFIVGHGREKQHTIEKDPFKNETSGWIDIVYPFLY